MIVYSPRAARQIKDLRQHYEARRRFEAVANMLVALNEAEGRIQLNPADGLLAPRPYPWLIRQDWAWVKAGRYWIGYRRRPRLVITAVFFEAADIPTRL